MATELIVEFDFRNKRYTDAALGLQAFANSLDQSVEKSGPVLSKDLRDFLDTVAQALATRHGQSWPGGTTPTTMSRRSGRGIQSIIESVKVTGTTFATIEGSIGASFRMKIHEMGGVIKAKRVKFLTIPLPAALNTDGTPIKQSAKQWDNTFVAMTKKGNLLIFRKSGHDIVPLYVLKPSVKIPPRLGMQKTLRAGLPYFVDTALDHMVKVMMQEIGSPA